MSDVLAHSPLLEGLQGESFISFISQRIFIQLLHDGMYKMNQYLSRQYLCVNIIMYERGPDVRLMT